MSKVNELRLTVASCGMPPPAFKLECMMESEMSTTNVDTFDTKQDAIDDATLYYDVDDVDFRGSNASGWTWSYVPPQARDTATAVTGHAMAQAETLGEFTNATMQHVRALDKWAKETGFQLRPYVSSADPTCMEIATLHPANGVACNRIGAIDPSSVVMLDAYLAAKCELEAAAVDATSEADLPTERKLELIDTPTEPYVYVVVGMAMPLRMATETCARLERKLAISCQMRAADTFAVVEREEPVRKGRAVAATVTSSVPLRPTCHVDGLAWSIELAPDEGNRKACESMKRRVDDLARARDLVGLRALSWAGCPGHASKGNTYQRQGAAYLANWIVEIERRIAFESAIIAQMTKAA